MKKLISTLLICFLTILFTYTAYANSGPIHEPADPGTELFIVDDQTEIVVEKEHLTFDFSNASDSTGVYGNVTATYTMKNPTNKVKNIKMAFPYVSSLEGSRDVSVTSNNIAVPYNQYICGPSEQFIATNENSNLDSYDFSKIVSAISDDEYQPINFKKTDVGKLYQINVTPTSNNDIFVGINFTYDPSKTSVILNGFNSFEYNDNSVKVQSICFYPCQLELYVLGDDIKYNIDTYLDPNLKKPTDLCDLKTTSRNIDVNNYIISNIKDTYHVEADTFMGKQLYNTCSKTLDESIYNNGCFEKDAFLKSKFSTNYMHAIVYSVDFLPNSENEISITYNAECNWSKKKTVTPMYSFQYILSPAKEWANFKNLSIDVLLPKKAPYIIDSNIDFTRTEHGTYTAFLDTLPIDDDLTFTFYKDSKISWFDNRDIRFAAIFIYIFGASAIILLVMLIKKIFPKKDGANE